jgi:hypothetical protein
MHQRGAQRLLQLLSGCLEAILASLVAFCDEREIVVAPCGHGRALHPCLLGGLLLCGS